MNINHRTVDKFKSIRQPLTNTKSKIKDAETNVEPEEEDDVGHFTEQEQVAYVLLQCDWEKENADK